jgi:hypothetical protein
MKPAVRRRLAALEARIEALETARPTVELYALDRVPISEPLDFQVTARTVFGEYNTGWAWDDEGDWRAGYI